MVGNLGIPNNVCDPANCENLTHPISLIFGGIPFRLPTVADSLKCTKKRPKSVAQYAYSHLLTNHFSSIVSIRFALYASKVGTKQVYIALYAKLTTQS